VIADLRAGAVSTARPVPRTSSAPRSSELVLRGHATDEDGHSGRALRLAAVTFARVLHARIVRRDVRDMIAWATEIKVRAERRAGEMLREMGKSHQRNISGKPSASGDGLPTLKKLGLTRDQSSDWQRLAEIPDVPEAA